MAQDDQVLEGVLPIGAGVTGVAPATVLGDGGGADAPFFLPHVDAGGVLGPAHAIHLLRLDGSSGLYVSACRLDGVGPGGADLAALSGWMWSRPDRWSAWGRVAVGLGTAALCSLIEREHALDPAAGADPDASVDQGDGEQADDAADEDVVEREDRATIWCSCEQEGYGRDRRYLLVLSRGSISRTPFFKLRYDRASDRDRVWDWMQHVAHRYHEFSAYLDAHDHDALKKLIYGGMLETERAVKKAGMGSGGYRPLRFWPGPDSADA